MSSAPFHGMSISGRKRSSNASNDEAEPVKAPKLQAGARVTINAQNAELDLVYPFWYESTSTGGNPSVNPPLLDPSGPLYVQSNMLKVRTAAPVEVANGSITLAYDDTLTLDDQNKLQINVEPNGPLRSTPDGLDLAIDSTLEVDNWELGVKLNPAGPIDASAAGLDINVDETLLVAEDSTNQRYELGVHLNPNGPITADSDGLDLEINPETLTVTNDSNTGGVLSVVLKPQGGLQSSLLGIGVAVDRTLTIDQNTVEVKIDPTGPLTSSDNGLSLDYDTTDFSVQAGKLSLLKTPTVSANAKLTSGSSTMTAFSAYIANSSQQNFNCSYYLQQWLVDGLIMTSLYLKLDRAHFSNMGSDESSRNAKWFTFWISSTSNFNLSNISEPTIEPSTVQWNAFLPASNYSQPASFQYTTSGGVTNMYYQPSSGAMQTFLPVTTGDWANTTYDPGSVNICALPVSVASSASSSRMMICFNFRCTNSGIFNSNATTGTMSIGPIFFTCPASAYTAP
ncbi:fiber [turkey adenovirus 4]|uniref:Fiber n=1 Tax=turkey adenovirus 4 TaxID=1408257 RepID=U5NHK6_9ADEN|nr:fiber [Turkey aviadenovirus 4]AGX93316.1 fiber [Turkey aviadenovirus 4]